MKSKNHRAFHAVFLAAAFVCLWAVHAAIAFAEPDGTPEKTFPAVLSRVPDKEVGRVNPLENDPQAVTAGGKLYAQHCVDCHGKAGAGTRRGPSLVSTVVQQAKPGAIFWILTNGEVRHGMPVWSKLPEPQRWQIVTFLKSLKPAPSGNAGGSPRGR